jgi:hypothetical protein
MKPVHQVLFAAGLVFLGIITWLLLTRPKPSATWLRVEAPVSISQGDPATIRVTLIGVEGNPQLNVDFHGTAQRNRPLRVVAAGQPQPVESSGGGLDFRLTVPARPDLTSVHAIIYLSPTGGWSDRIRVAKSDPIPVETGPSTDRSLHPLPSHDHTSDPVIPRLETTGLRYLIAGLWLAGGSVLALRCKRARREKAGEPSARGVLLMAACVGVALTELLRIESLVGRAARQLAFKHGFYDERVLPQQLAILLLVLGVTALAVFILLRARNRRFALGLLLHTAIAFAAILSLHEVDALIYATAFGLPLEQLAKLSAVSFSLWGLRTPIARRLA